MINLKEMSFHWRTVLIVFLVFISLTLFLLNSLLNEEITQMKTIGVYISYSKEPTAYLLTFSTYALVWLASLIYLALSLIKYINREKYITISQKPKRRRKNKK